VLLNAVYTSTAGSSAQRPLGKLEVPLPERNRYVYSRASVCWPIAGVQGDGFAGGSGAVLYAYKQKPGWWAVG
jgi:hypothetical protein